MLIALTKGMGPVTSSYIGSLSALFDGSQAALIFALFLVKIMTSTVMETTTQTIRAVARELIDIVYTLLVSEFCTSVNALVCSVV